MIIFYSESLHLERAITYAAKAAYMAAVIKYGQKELRKFNNAKIQDMKDWLIKEPISTKLNKLKKQMQKRSSTYTNYQK